MPNTKKLLPSLRKIWIKSMLIIKNSSLIHYLNYLTLYKFDKGL